MQFEAFLGMDTNKVRGDGRPFIERVARIEEAIKRESFLMGGRDIVHTYKLKLDICIYLGLVCVSLYLV